MSWELRICSLIISHKHQVREVLPGKSERFRVFSEITQQPKLSDSAAP